MSDTIADAASGPQIRLDTLINLRWLAVAGQTAAVLIVGVGLQFPMPIILSAALIATSALLNIALKLRFPASRRLEGGAAALMLAYDLIQLGCLLFLTGGLANPFSILIVAPVTVSAATLGLTHTIALGSLGFVVATLLSFFHLPLPWPPNSTLELPFIYVAGVWVALTSAIAFMGIYAFRVAEEARLLARALTATELALAREHRISALDGLAAAAAHELGTPLATISVVARELQREMPEGTPYADDLALLVSQSQRCRDILAKLSSRSADSDGLPASEPITDFLAEVAEPHRVYGVAITVTTGDAAGPPPMIPRNPAILYGLGNLIENAAEFASARVEIAAAWTAGEVSVTIRDDGPGFSPDIIGRMGEPYVTSRARTEGNEEAGGLGLGFFIAKTLLERSGARLTLENRQDRGSGAVVTVVWPRATIDQGQFAPGGYRAAALSEQTARAG